MPKPPRADRPVEKTLSLPGSVVGRVDLILFSDVEGRVPHGAWRDYILELIEKDLKRRALLQATQRKLMEGGDGQG